jgi:hypothetical protein
MMKFPTSVSLSVTCRTPEEFVTTYERLSRQAAGIMLDDQDATVLTYPSDEEE